MADNKKEVESTFPRFSEVPIYTFPRFLGSQPHQHFEDIAKNGPKDFEDFAEPLSVRLLQDEKAPPRTGPRETTLQTTRKKEAFFKYQFYELDSLIWKSCSSSYSIS